MKTWMRKAGKATLKGLTKGLSWIFSHEEIINIVIQAAEEAAKKEAAKQG